jgi:hypothetical protein
VDRNVAIADRNVAIVVNAENHFVLRIPSPKAPKERLPFRAASSILSFKRWNNAAQTVVSDILFARYVPAGETEQYPGHNRNAGDD